MVHGALAPAQGEHQLSQILVRTQVLGVDRQGSFIGRQRQLVALDLAQAVAKQVVGIGVVGVGEGVGLQQLNRAPPSLFGNGLARLADRSFFGRWIAMRHVYRASWADKRSGQNKG
jgi:hypothetical protein